MTKSTEDALLLASKEKSPGVRAKEMSAQSCSTYSQQSRIKEENAEPQPRPQLRRRLDYSLERLKGPRSAMRTSDPGN